MGMSSLGIGAVTALLFMGSAQAQTGQQPAMGKMPGMGAPISAAGAQQASSIGTVMSVDAARHKVKLDHEPIPAIGWPAMKMEFPAAASVDLSKVKPGSKVQFTLSGAHSSYTVQAITPAP